MISGRSIAKRYAGARLGGSRRRMAMRWMLRDYIGARLAAYAQSAARVIAGVVALTFGVSTYADAPDVPRSDECVPPGLESRLLAGPVQLRYWRGGSADLPAIVFLHGIAEQASTFFPVMRLLQTYFRIIAIDLRGHGRSGATPSQYVTEAYAKDVIRVLDAERVPRAILVGHSLGALISLRVANQNPERVLGVVAEDPPLALDDSVPEPATRVGLTTFLEYLRGLPTGATREEAVRRAVAEWPADTGILGQGLTYADVLDQCGLRSESEAVAAVDPDAVASLLRSAAYADVRRVLMTMNIPVRMLVGNPMYGGVVTVRDEKNARKLLGGLSVVRLYGAGHSIHSAFPALYAAEVLAFANDVLSPQSCIGEKALLNPSTSRATALTGVASANLSNSDSGKH